MNNNTLKEAKARTDKIIEDLCSVQPISKDQKSVDAFNTLWDITVNQKKTLIITSTIKENKDV
jgi:hypothetical protein